jgi:hypothetical protein
MANIIWHTVKIENTNFHIPYYDKNGVSVIWQLFDNVFRFDRTIKSIDYGNLQNIINEYQHLNPKIGKDEVFFTFTFCSDTIESKSIEDYLLKSLEIPLTPNSSDSKYNNPLIDGSGFPTFPNPESRSSDFINSNIQEVVWNSNDEVDLILKNGEIISSVDVKFIFSGEDHYFEYDDDESGEWERSYYVNAKVNSIQIKSRCIQVRYFSLVQSKFGFRLRRDEQLTAVIKNQPVFYYVTIEPEFEKSQRRSNECELLSEVFSFLDEMLINYEPDEVKPFWLTYYYSDSFRRCVSGSKPFVGEIDKLDPSFLYPKENDPEVMDYKGIGFSILNFTDITMKEYNKISKFNLL